MSKKIALLNEHGLDNFGNMVPSKPPRVDKRKKKSLSTSDGLRSIQQVVERSREQMVTELNDDILGSSRSLSSTTTPSTPSTGSSIDSFTPSEEITDGGKEDDIIDNEIESIKQVFIQKPTDTEHQLNGSSINSLLSSLKRKYEFFFI